MGGGSHRHSYRLLFVSKKLEVSVTPPPRGASNNMGVACNISHECRPLGSQQKRSEKKRLWAKTPTHLCTWWARRNNSAIERVLYDYGWNSILSTSKIWNCWLQINDSKIHHLYSPQKPRTETNCVPLAVIGVTVEPSTRNDACVASGDRSPTASGGREQVIPDYQSSSAVKQSPIHFFHIFLRELTRTRPNYTTQQIPKDTLFDMPWTREAAEDSTICVNSKKKKRHPKTTQQLVISTPNMQCASHLVTLKKRRIAAAIQILRGSKLCPSMASTRGTKRFEDGPTAESHLDAKSVRVKNTSKMYKTHPKIGPCELSDSPTNSSKPLPTKVVRKFSIVELSCWSSRQTWPIDPNKFINHSTIMDVWTKSILARSLAIFWVGPIRVKQIDCVNLRSREMDDEQVL